jgi:hypothetical protein
MGLTLPKLHFSKGKTVRRISVAFGHVDLQPERQPGPTERPVSSGETIKKHE